MTYEQVGKLTDIGTTASSEPRRNPLPRSSVRAPADGTLEQFLLRCILNQPRLALDLPLELLEVYQRLSPDSVTTAQLRKNLHTLSEQNKEEKDLKSVLEKIARTEEGVKVDAAIKDFKEKLTRPDTYMVAEPPEAKGESNKLPPAKGTPFQR